MRAFQGFRGVCVCVCVFVWFWPWFANGSEWLRVEYGWRRRWHRDGLCTHKHTQMQYYHCDHSTATCLCLLSSNHYPLPPQLFVPIVSPFTVSPLYHPTVIWVLQQIRREDLKMGKNTSLQRSFDTRRPVKHRVEQSRCQDLNVLYSTV